MELAEEVFGAVNEDLLWEAVTHYRAAARAGTHATKNRARFRFRQEAVEARRAREGRVSARSVRHCGVTRHRPRTAAAFLRLRLPEEKTSGRVALGAGLEVSDGKLRRGESLRRKRAEDETVSRSARQIENRRTTLLVDISTVENKNLDLSARNIDGLELVKANEGTRIT